MRVTPYILLLLIIHITSVLSMYLLYRFMDIERDIVLSVGSMGISALLAVMSLVGIVLYFIKRIWYRGEVSFATLMTSVRQGTLLAIFLLAMIAFHRFGIMQVSTVGLLASTLICLELLIGSLDTKH
ncbi:MAG TPA: hypothetical protein PK765_03935 [bacterium]|nr:hypothetical protein [bacterium]